jgi:hypothetical protein
MALPVDVSSIDVLRSVREALILFGDDGRNALGTMDMEIQRCVDWLANDQRLYWQSEVKRRIELLARAKAELHRKGVGLPPGAQPHDSEQREAVREAKHRLEEAEDKLENVKRWVPVLDRAVMEYQGQAKPFAEVLEFDVERAVELVDRMIGALDDYVRMTAPTTAQDRPSGVSSSTAIPIAKPATESLATAATAEVPSSEPETEGTPETTENV